MCAIIELYNPWTREVFFAGTLQECVAALPTFTDPDEQVHAREELRRQYVELQWAELEINQAREQLDLASAANNAMMELIIHHLAVPNRQVEQLR